MLILHMTGIEMVWTDLSILIQFRIIDNVENQFLQSPKGATHDVTTHDTSRGVHDSRLVATVQKCDGASTKSNTFNKDQ